MRQSRSSSRDMVESPIHDSRVVQSPGGREYLLDTAGRARRIKGEIYDPGSEFHYDPVYGHTRPDGNSFYTPSEAPSLPDVNIDPPFGGPSEAHAKRPLHTLSGHDLMKIFPPSPPNPPPHGYCDALFRKQMHAFLSEFPAARAQATTCRRDLATDGLPVARTRSDPSPTSPVQVVLPEADTPPGSRRAGAVARAPLASYPHAAFSVPPPQPPSGRHRRDSQPPGHHAQSPQHSMMKINGTHPPSPVHPFAPHQYPASDDPAKTRTRHHSHVGAPPQQPDPRAQQQRHASVSPAERPRTPLSSAAPKITLIQCNPQNTHPYNPPLTKAPFVRRNDTETAHLQKLERERERERERGKTREGEGGYIPRMRAPKKTCGREDCKIPYCRSVHHRKPRAGQQQQQQQRERAESSGSTSTSRSRYTIDLTGESDDA